MAEEQQFVDDLQVAAVPENLPLRPCKAELSPRNLLQIMSKGEQGQWNQFQVLDGKWNADNNDGQDCGAGDMGQSDGPAEQQKPQNIEHQGQEAIRILHLWESIKIRGR